MKKTLKTIPFCLSGCLCICISGCRQIQQLTTMYLAGNTVSVTIQDEEGNPISIPRGTAVQMPVGSTQEDTVLVYLNDQKYTVPMDFLKDRKEDCVMETVLYVNETVPAFVSEDDLSFSEMVSYRQKVSILGHSEVLEDGSVEWYQTEYGMVHASHLDHTPVEDDTDYRSPHMERGDMYGGGSAADLDYTPHTSRLSLWKKSPETINAIYLNGSALTAIDSYIEAARNSSINTFVIDIKDADVIAVAAKTMEKYSPSSYKRAISNLQDYCQAVSKARKAGIYTIGRITTFKDTWYASDHPEHAIISAQSGTPYELYGAFWPTPYSHDVWKYNVELAVEMAEEAGFDEIQFDYVRFPESVDWYHDYLGEIDLRNTENISRAQAVQQFLLYAAEILHRNHVLVSADVFGETSNAYVTAYGQYWPAISNVVDAICAMPYPDHFSIHDYGIPQAVWEVPQQLLTYWGEHVSYRQAETTTPSRTVTYIQGYDSLFPPYVIYDRQKIDEQIQGLKDAGIYDGHIIWNSSSDLNRYISYTQ